MQKTLRPHFVLPVVVLYLYLVGSAPFLGQWDSFDYLKQIVSHRLSDLGVGRPVFLGYNILLWDSLRKIFHLAPLHVEFVVMGGTILLGVLGVILFRKLANHIVGAQQASMASLAFAISPVYFIYSGFIMTEVPMLAALLAAALLLWKHESRHAAWRDIAGGIFFGLAVGIREQALTLAAAYLWILFTRSGSVQEKLRSTLRFAAAGVVVALAPAVAWYVFDPVGFIERTKTWIHAIPMSSRQFWNNAQASMLFTFIVCPAAWLAATVAFGRRFFVRNSPIPVECNSPERSIGHPAWGVFCCLLLPIMILWRDADVQMHPRYALIALPASVILCVTLYGRWMPSKRGATVWAIMHVITLGIALAAFWPYRHTQTAKMEFARLIKTSVPGKALIIAGNCSPVLDYYREIGVRPKWQIVWSGWDWNPSTVRARVMEAWKTQVPVYWSTEPSGWSYFEREFLEAYYIFKDDRKEAVIPHLYRVLPSPQ